MADTAPAKECQEWEATMTKTTPTGIPIEHCGPCGYSHAVNRPHCANCRRASLFAAHETGLCLPCRHSTAGQTDIFQQLKEIQ